MKGRVVEKIFDAGDLCERDGVRSHVEWIVERCRRIPTDTPFTGKVRGKPVEAVVNYGRWVARCECGGVEYVSKREKVFYCFSCCNLENGGDGRPVVFPENVEEIEALLLARPVDARVGINALDRALRSKPVAAGLSRSWEAGESADDLREQNRMIRKVRDGI